jgi:hypothetical protein
MRLRQEPYITHMWWGEVGIFHWKAYELFGSALSSLGRLTIVISILALMAKF